MAAQFAKNLLAEIETEGLDELLLSQYAIAQDQTPAYLSVPTLDTLLRPYLHSRSKPTERPAHPPFIEIAGAGPCSGKTQLLYRIAAGLLLGDSTAPSGQDDLRDTDPHEAAAEVESLHAEAAGEPEEPAIAGRPGGVVIWIDCASTFDIRRLDRILSSIAPSDALSSRLATLTHFHLHRPASFSALLDTLSDLPSDLLGRSARTGSSASAHRPVSALILSAASSFLPFERAAAHASSTIPYSVLDARYARLVALLRTVQHRLGCPVIATRRAGGVGPSLPASWVTAVEIRLRVSRGDWREKVPRGISVLEALERCGPRRDARARAEDDARAKERDAREMRMYLEGREANDEGAETATERETASAVRVRFVHQQAEEPSAHFNGSVAGKGREASAFVMRVNSGEVWIEVA